MLPTNAEDEKSESSETETETETGSGSGSGDESSDDSSNDSSDTTGQLTSTSIAYSRRATVARESLFSLTPHLSRRYYRFRGLYQWRLLIVPQYPKASEARLYERLYLYRWRLPCL